MVDVKERPLVLSNLVIKNEPARDTFGRCYGVLVAQGWTKAAQQLALEFHDLKRRKNPNAAIAARTRQLAPVKL